MPLIPREFSPSSCSQICRSFSYSVSRSASFPRSSRISASISSQRTCFFPARSSSSFSAKFSCRAFSRSICVCCALCKSSRLVSSTFSSFPITCSCDFAVSRYTEIFLLSFWYFCSNADCSRWVFSRSVSFFSSPRFFTISRMPDSILNLRSCTFCFSSRYRWTVVCSLTASSCVDKESSSSVFRLPMLPTRTSSLNRSSSSSCACSFAFSFSKI
mmetsp:Transcript_25180/g.63375  ORF Transcript_25180/g.63375 Transcript_25180/m.63375 type:complete len:215 (-) Transcript_25180:3032-3676(-)